MEKEIFRQFEKQFGAEWVCECGSTFDIEWVEIVSQNKSSVLAKYFCRICGREQMFAATTGDSLEFIEVPIIEIPTEPITSDDVLDIKEEIATLSFGKIRSITKRRATTKVPVQKS